MRRQLMGTVDRWPALVVLLGFSALRFVDFLLLELITRRDQLSPLRLLISWDAEWYGKAAIHGWPDLATLSASGTLESTWAWPPVYPLLVRGAAAMFGGAGVGIAQVLINFTAGAAAAVVLFYALRPSVGTRSSVGIALLWSSMPAAPVFLMGYAEGVFVLAVFGAIWASLRNRWVLAGMLLVVGGLTKSSIAPYALAIAIAAVVSWRDHSRTDRPSGRSLSVVLASAAIAVVAWPLVAAYTLGSLDAYLQVHGAWARSSVPFWDALKLLYSAGSSPTSDAAVVVAVLLVALVAAVAVWKDRRFPLVVRVIGILVPALLVAVGPGLSTTRLMLPNLALPVWVWKFTRGLGMVVLVSGVLLLLRYLWMAIYVSFIPGYPPP